MILLERIVIVVILNIFATTSLFGDFKPHPEYQTHIPEWVTRTPTDCFVGISGFCQSVGEARRQALDSALSQILEAMGAEYQLRHISILSGDKSQTRHRLNERLVYTAKWFLRSAYQNIIRSEIVRIGDKYIYYVLIHFPPEKIENLRRLSIGPKVSARIVKTNRGTPTIELNELNGVGVTLTDYRAEIKSIYRHAKFITLFAFKVPGSSHHQIKGVIGHAVSLNGNSTQFELPLSKADSKIKQLILGTQKHVKIVLKGYDEIGRKVSVKAQSSP